MEEEVEEEVQGWKVEEAGEVVKGVEELGEEEQTAELAPVQLCLSGLKSRQTKTGSRGVYKIKLANNRPRSFTHSLMPSATLCVCISGGLHVACCFQLL